MTEAGEVLKFINAFKDFIRTYGIEPHKFLPAFHWEFNSGISMLGNCVMTGLDGCRFVQVSEVTMNTDSIWYAAYEFDKRL